VLEFIFLEMSIPRIEIVPLSIVYHGNNLDLQLHVVANFQNKNLLFWSINGGKIMSGPFEKELSQILSLTNDKNLFSSLYSKLLRQQHHQPWIAPLRTIIEDAIPFTQPKPDLRRFDFGTF
jgi:hypothetical protein